MSVVSDVQPAGGRLSEVVLFCLEGRLAVGDRLHVAEAPDGTSEPIDAEVVEIRFFQQMIDGLDPVFSGQVLVSGSIGHVAEGWTLRATRS